MYIGCVLNRVVNSGHISQKFLRALSLIQPTERHLDTACLIYIEHVISALRSRDCRGT